MGRYRCAALVAAIMYFVAGFGVAAARTMAYFDTSLGFVNGDVGASGGVGDVVEELGVVEERGVVDIAADAKIVQAPGKAVGAVVGVQTGVCGGYYGYISVGGRNVCLKSTDSTGGSLSYSYGYVFNSAVYGSYNSYIFAHNSAGLFGGLKDLGVGTRFSVTIGGQVSNYQISKKVVYCDYSNPTHPCSNYAEPVLNMYDAIRPSRQGADLALMTCAGQSIGNGDATHRLMVYAVRA